MVAINGDQDERIIISINSKILLSGIWQQYVRALLKLKLESDRDMSSAFHPCMIYATLASS